MPSLTANCRRPRGLPIAARGFTIIELMVAIAIIIVLMGIVVFGYRRVAIGSQESQTRTILERLRSMQSTVTANPTAGQKFFQIQIPAIYSFQFAPYPTSTSATPPQLWDAIPADSEDAVAKTAQVLSMLIQSPEAKAIFDELPTNRKRTMFFDKTTGGQVVSSADTAVPPKTLTATMPLDAWGNPILFVYDNWQESTGQATSKVRTLAAGGPTGGLTYVWSASAKGYWKPLMPQNVQQPSAYAANKVNEPSGYNQNLGTALRSPDRQPFWVSAGPDGLMQTHDDNVYSFEN